MNTFVQCPPFHHNCKGVWFVANYGASLLNQFKSVGVGGSNAASPADYCIVRYSSLATTSCCTPRISASSGNIICSSPFYIQLMLVTKENESYTRHLYALVVSNGSKQKAASVLLVCEATFRQAAALNCVYLRVFFHLLHPITVVLWRPCRNKLTYIGICPWRIQSPWFGNVMGYLWSTFMHWSVSLTVSLSVWKADKTL